MQVLWLTKEGGHSKKAHPIKSRFGISNNPPYLPRGMGVWVTPPQPSVYAGQKVLPSKTKWLEFIFSKVLKCVVRGPKRTILVFWGPGNPPPVVRPEHLWQLKEAPPPWSRGWRHPNNFYPETKGGTVRKIISHSRNLVKNCAVRSLLSVGRGFNNWEGRGGHLNSTHLPFIKPAYV